MEKLKEQYDELQLKYGSSELNSVYGYGCEINPKIALVFMNPTKRNIATNKNWTGIRAQWLGIKQIWDFLTKCNLFNPALNDEIKKKEPKDWTPEFCEIVYDEVKKQKLWITNLAKCTQEDAKPLPDNVFIQYKDLLLEELSIIKPQKIFLFGNQISSIILNENISVSTVRRKKFNIEINGENYDCISIYYPVGHGRFNQSKAIEDITHILKENS